ncbi:unnamed protein product [Blepharisma stoltei]|uniref:Uncharacterized protein n=1 Tax=Blepharisma stoltei TaxID=1481888 RepID=A0AAU9JVP6_9CILI|nr:unnamed protein product [Blepharisma stoltei]
MSDKIQEEPTLRKSQSGLLRQSLTTLKSTRSVKSLPTVMKECPLSDPSIGVISENDHRVGLCLCPLCTCGKHKCPGPISIEPYPKSMFNTQYTDNFHKHKPARPAPFKSINNFYSNQLIDFETTSEQFFKPIVTQPVLSLPAYRPNPPPQMGLSGLTSYSSNFPSWGTGGVYYVKQAHIRHTNDSLPLANKTSYTEGFRALDEEELKMAKKANQDLSAFRASVGMKCGSMQAVKESVTKRDFVDWSKKNLMERAPRPVDNILKQHITGDHFVTSARNDFKQYDSSIDHRNLRKRLEREGIITQEFR